MYKGLTLGYLHGKLRAFGFNQKFIDANLMPAWWTNVLINSQPALWECAAIMCNRTGLNLESLLDPDKQLFFNYDKNV